MPDLFEVIVGTYEQYLLGYKVNNIVNVRICFSLLFNCRLYSMFIHGFKMNYLI